MSELEPRINKVSAEPEKRSISLITDNELTENRQKEIDLIFPEFNHEVIYGLKGTPEESSKQFEAAKNYFDSIIEMGGKPGALKKFALRLEKLQNTNKSPKWIEDNFEKIVEEKRSRFGQLIKLMIAAGRKNFSETNDGWDSFFKKAESGGQISLRERNHFEEAITKERLGLMADFPDFRREAVIYYPKLAGEWKTDLMTTYNNNSKIKTLGERAKRRREKIQRYESIFKR